MIPRVCEKLASTWIDMNDVCAMKFKYDQLTCSPGRGKRVVWLMENPKRVSPSMSLLMRVPLPTPDGPTMTRADGWPSVPVSV